MPVGTMVFALTGFQVQISRNRYKIWSYMPKSKVMSLFFSEERASDSNRLFRVYEARVVIHFYSPTKSLFIEYTHVLEYCQVHHLQTIFKKLHLFL